MLPMVKSTLVLLVSVQTLEQAFDRGYKDTIDFLLRNGGLWIQ